MKFEENLVKLRKSKGLSQEELAEKLDVSRQTVYKWESGQSYPELDRLVMISKHFGYTIDELLNKDLAISDDGMKIKYDRFYNRYSFFTAFGVFFIIMAVAAMLALFALYKEEKYYIPLTVFFVLLLIGISILIAFGIQADYFNKTIPNDTDFYTLEEREIFSKKYAIGIIVGIGCLFLAIVSLFFSMAAFPALYAVALMLAIIAVGVFFLVYFGCLDAKYKMQHPVRNRHENEKVGKISSVVMLSAVIIYLIIGFVFEKWHPGWVVFPIGGIACGIVEVIAKKEQ